jgi:hypothetical protein
MKNIDDDFEKLMNFKNIINQDNKKYSKLIKNYNIATDEDSNNINIKIKLIAIIYKDSIDTYQFKFKIIKKENQDNIENYINDESFYVIHDMKTNINDCRNLNNEFKQNTDYNNFLNKINTTDISNNMILSYTIDDTIYNIILSIPIIIILTKKDETKKLILININEKKDTEMENGKGKGLNCINLKILTTVSKELFRSIKKYLKYNFENEIKEIIENSTLLINNIEIYSTDKEYNKEITEIPIDSTKQKIKLTLAPSTKPVRKEIPIRVPGNEYLNRTPQSLKSNIRKVDLVKYADYIPKQTSPNK